jgi:hypothetical protein
MKGETRNSHKILDHVGRAHPVSEDDTIKKYKLVEKI